MAKSITKAEKPALSADSREMLEMGRLLVESQMLPSDINTTQKAFLILQQGKELGLQPMQAINNVVVVKGRTTLSSNMMTALVLKSGKVKFKVTEWTEEVCEIVFTRDGEDYPPVDFTIEDAKKAGYTNKDNWRKHPKEMLKARAFAKGARLYCGDIIQGMYTTEEIQESDTSSYNSGGNLHETVEEVYQSVKDDINSAQNLSQLQKVGIRIKRNGDQGLIAQDSLDELRKLYVEKEGEFNQVETVKAEAVDAEIVNDKADSAVSAKVTGKAKSKVSEKRDGGNK